MQFLVELLMNCFYGEQIRKDIEEEYWCKPEYWMSSENDERIKEHWRLPTRKYIVKLSQDEGLEDNVLKIYTVPLHLGSFVLSNSQRNKNSFNRAINSFKSNDVYYQDRDILCIEKKHWKK